MLPHKKKCYHKKMIPDHTYLNIISICDDFNIKFIGLDDIIDYSHGAINYHYLIKHHHQYYIIRTSPHDILWFSLSKEQEFLWHKHLQTNGIKIT